MAKGRKREELLNGKRERKASEMAKNSGQSNYARKRAYLNRNGGFGSDYPDPKPWKTK